MRSVTITSSPLKDTLFLYVTCECGSTYLAEEGGGIATTHHINKKEKYEEIYSCNYCNKNYKLTANLGSVEISKAPKKPMFLKYLSLTHDDLISLSPKKRTALVIIKKEIDGKMVGVKTLLKKHPTRSFSWRDPDGREYVLHPGLSAI